jgi:hypothetical protein
MLIVKTDKQQQASTRHHHIIKYLMAATFALTAMSGSPAWAIRVVGAKKPEPPKAPEKKAPEKKVAAPAKPTAKPAPVKAAIKEPSKATEKPAKTPAKVAVEAAPAASPEVVAAAAPEAASAKLSAGDRCTTDAKMNGKIVGAKKAKPLKFAANTEVTVKSVLTNQIRLTTAKGDMLIDRKWVEAHCKVSAPSPVASEAVASALPVAAPIAPTAAPQVPVGTSVNMPPADVSAELPPVVVAVALPTAPPAINPPETRLGAMSSPTLSAAATDDLQARRSKAKTIRTIAWTSTIVGAVGLGTGGTLVGLSFANEPGLTRDINSYNNDPLRRTGTFSGLQSRQREISTFRTAGIVAGGIGAAALATGIILFIVGDSPSTYAEVASGLRLDVSSQATTLSFNGSF